MLADVNRKRRKNNTNNPRDILNQNVFSFLDLKCASTLSNEILLPNSNFVEGSVQCT